MKRRAFVRSTLTAAVAATVPGFRPLSAFPRFSRQDPPDVEAITGDGKPVTLKGKQIVELAGRLRGRLLLATDAGYDEARRILNPSFDKRPALIVQPTGTADVRSAVEFAGEHRLLVAVKCGGHSLSGQSTCDRGLQIDLSAFRGVRVDPAARRAWVAGGTLLGQVDHETMAQGLVTPLGTVSHTGVGGLVLGGGFGRVARRFGLAIDNLTAVEVVTADGRIVHADPDENADLYWGVRGGGGNFGIVTSFVFQLHPMERQVLGGQLVFPIERARDLLEVFGQYGSSAPDDLYFDPFIGLPPGGGKGVAGLSICYSGPADRADQVLAPIRKLGTPMADGLKAMDYTALQRSGDVTDPRAMGLYVKGGFIPSLPADLIAAIVDGFAGHPARGTQLFFQHCGGAIARVAPDATAFPHRTAHANLLTAVAWKMGDDPAEHIRWIRDYWATLEPFSRGFYVNDADPNATAETLNANYLGNYPRLVAVKNKYDPTNLFRLNANVKPTAV
jgi:FAD/FMN-containing dehydrogenase